MSKIKSQKIIPQILQQVIRDFFEELRNPDPWRQALAKFKKQRSSEGIKCPICGEPYLNFWYSPHSSKSVNRKWNRFGDAWINCRKCGGWVEFHGLKIPDWYIGPSDKCTTCGKKLETEEDKITAFCSKECQKLHFTEYRRWRITYFIFWNLVYIFLFIGIVGMLIINPFFPTLNLGSWPHLIFFFGGILWLVRSLLPFLGKPSNP